MRCYALALGVLLLSPVAAADGDSYWVKPDAVLDVERGALRDGLAIRVDGERIGKIVPASAIPDGASVLDWSGHVAMPGLIDLHTHLVGDIQGASPAAPLLSSAARDALVGAANARATLHAGFTTVRDVGTYRAFVDVALRDAINAAQVEGPRMYVAGAYLTVSKGGGEVTGLAPDVEPPAEMRRGVADDVALVRRRVRELINGGADFVKVIATGAVLTAGTTPGAPEYDEAELRAAVDEAANAGRFVVAHAHGAEGIHRAVRAGVRSIEHGSYLDAEGIRLMREHGTWLVADVYNGTYIAQVGRRDGWPAEILRKNDETTGTQRAGFREAVKAGVRVGFGTDAGVFPHGLNARQFAFMVEHGMTPAQAIRAATVDAARALGREGEFGVIREGLAADLIAVRGDPLADVRRLEDVRAVIARGRVAVPLRHGDVAR
ncbi:MAG: amidohydrolase family protein [Pseudomonadota bacterium]